MLTFPRIVSFTLTYACNLRCRMCGQYGLKQKLKTPSRKVSLPLQVWEKAIEELARHKGAILLIRGGEPFLYPSIVGLLRFAKERDIFVSIDTNGMFLKEYASDIARLRVDNLVVSIDGPPEVHDSVRGVKGSFKRIQDGLEALQAAEKRYRVSIPKILCFVISPYSYSALDKIPDVAQQLKIPRLTIVPYYFFCRKTGIKYEKIMRDKFQCAAYSWRGFHHEKSGINIKEFSRLLKGFKQNLKDVAYEPFMDFSKEEYAAWFSNSYRQAKKHTCRNPWLLVDIQPNGDVNFCVDFPDYTIGNIRDNTLGEIWKGEKAEKFRAYLQKRPLPICFRCGAQYIAG